MNSLHSFLLFCSVLSALTVSAVFSQNLQISVEPPKPSLVGPILINCTADVVTKKIISLAIFRGKEEILTFNPTNRPRINWPDESLKSRFTFYKSLKKQTILSLELKNPRCTDQNLYSCVLNQKNKDEETEQKRVDFYVQKQGVELTQNKATNCLHVDITCVGHAGNPPEHMGWFKKSLSDNEFTRIDPSYITGNMEFHTENCSNTRTERLVYKPTYDEQDFIVKCGFGDMTKELTMRMPGQDPKDVKLMIKGETKVGETIELDCSGKILSSVEHSIIFYKRTELNSEFTKVIGAVLDDITEEQDDCMSLVTKKMSYTLTQKDKELELMCRLTADGKTRDDMAVVDVEGLFVAPTGIPVDKPDLVPEEDNTDEYKGEKDSEMDNGDDNDMDDKMSMVVTSAPEPEPEGEGKDKEEDKEEEIEDKGDEVVKISEGNSSGMLRGYCLLVLGIALLVMV